MSRNCFKGLGVVREKCPQLAWNTNYRFLSEFFLHLSLFSLVTLFGRQLAVNLEKPGLIRHGECVGTARLCLAAKRVSFGGCYLLWGQGNLPMLWLKIIPSLVLKLTAKQETPCYYLQLYSVSESDPFLFLKTLGHRVRLCNCQAVQLKFIQMSPFLSTNTGTANNSQVHGRIGLLPPQP